MATGSLGLVKQTTVNIHKQTSSVKMEDESFEESEEDEVSGGDPMDVDAKATEQNL